MGVAVGVAVGVGFGFCGVAVVGLDLRCDGRFYLFRYGFGFIFVCLRWF